MHLPHLPGHQLWRKGQSQPRVSRCEEAVRIPNPYHFSPGSEFAGRRYFQHIIARQLQKKSLASFQVHYVFAKRCKKPPARGLLYSCDGLVEPAPCGWLPEPHTSWTPRLSYTL